MSDDNPFDVSLLFQSAGSILEIPAPKEFRVEGDLIVCGPVVELPAICVRTLTTADLKQQSQTALFPALKIVLISRQCTVHYSLSRTVWVRETLVRAGCLIGMVAGILILFFLAPVSGSGFLFGLFLVGASLIVASLRRPVLKLMKYQHPGICCVRGFSREYLQKISQGV